MALSVAQAIGLPDGGAVPEVAPLHFTQRVIPEQVRLGSPFEYELVIRHRPDKRFELRAPKDLGPFELLEQRRSRTDQASDAITSFKLKLSLFELGKKRLPDLTFEVTQPAGTGQFVVPGIEVEGLSSLSKDVDQREPSLYDIKAPEDIPIRTYRLLWGLLAVFGAGLLAYGVYRWMRRPRPPAAVEAKALEPLDVRTLAALDQLRGDDLAGAGRYREFYFRLSEIVRAYLGELYRFEALECTNTELLAALRRLRTPGLSLPELQRFSDESDLVKFAKAEATPEHCKQSLEFAYGWVRQTFPSTASSAPVQPHVQRPRVP
jgi:hypothetical protein